MDGRTKRGKRMTGEGDKESWQEPLIEQRQAREGLVLKLDRGFEEGTYCVYVHFHELTSRVGYAGARQRAEEYCGMLKSQIDRFAGHTLGETEDAFGAGRSARPKHEQLYYLTFPVVMMGGRFRDQAMKKEFQAAVVRASQQWDQTQSRMDAQKQDSRRDAFRLQFDALLDREAYQHLDKATKERLLEEVPALAFPPRGINR